MGDAIRSDLKDLNREATIILLSRGIKTFPFGFLSVMVPVYLATIGSAFLVGAFFFVSSMSSISLLLFLSTFGHKFNVRNILIFQSFSTAAALAMLSYTPIPALVLLAAAFSITNWAPGGGSGTGAGPYNTTLNLLLSEKIAKSSRTLIFSISSILGTLCFAAGAAFLSVANDLNIGFLSTGLPAVAKEQSGLFVLAMIVQIAAGFILFAVSAGHLRKANSVKKMDASQSVEISHSVWEHYPNEIGVKNSEGGEPGPRKTGVVRVLGEAMNFIVAEFLNGFGNGLFLKLIPLWFFVRFSIDIATIGEISAVAGIITASVALLSSRLERRIGSTSAIFLGRGGYAFLVVAMALAPSLATAIVIYYITLVVSRVAAPIQQSFVFAKIPSEDWTRASGMVGVANSLGGSLGPILGAYLLLDVNASFAFIVALPFLLTSGLIYFLGFRSKSAGKGFSQKPHSWLH